MTHSSLKRKACSVDLFLIWIELVVSWKCKAQWIPWKLNQKKIWAWWIELECTKKVSMEELILLVEPWTITKSSSVWRSPISTWNQNYLKAKLHLEWTSLSFQMASKGFSLRIKKIKNLQFQFQDMLVTNEVTDLKTFSERVSENRAYRAKNCKENFQAHRTTFSWSIIHINENTTLLIRL